MRSSAWLASATPEGCLWARMTAAALMASGGGLVALATTVLGPAEWEWGLGGAVIALTLSLVGWAAKRGGDRTIAAVE